MVAAFAEVPATAKQLLASWGPVLKDPNVQASLLYLKAYGHSVKNAAAAPHQWQRFIWIVVAGQIAFIPLIFVVAGLWDPRKAQRQAQHHGAWLQFELAKPATTQPQLALDAVSHAR